jgi:hypothetical protein
MQRASQPSMTPTFVDVKKWPRRVIHMCPQGSRALQRNQRSLPTNRFISSPPDMGRCRGYAQRLTRIRHEDQSNVPIIQEPRYDQPQLRPDSISEQCGRCCHVFVYPRSVAWETVSKMVNQHWEVCPNTMLFVNFTLLGGKASLIERLQPITGAAVGHRGTNSRCAFEQHSAKRPRTR